MYAAHQDSKNQKKYSHTRLILNPILFAVDEECEFNEKFSHIIFKTHLVGILSNRVTTIFDAIIEKKYDDAAMITREIIDDGKFSPVIYQGIKASLCRIHDAQMVYKQVSWQDAQVLQASLVAMQEEMKVLIQATNYGGVLLSLK